MLRHPTLEDDYARTWEQSTRRVQANARTWPDADAASPTPPLPRRGIALISRAGPDYFSWV
jgi:hypothetical protein